MGPPLPQPQDSPASDKIDNKLRIEEIYQQLRDSDKLRAAWDGKVKGYLPSPVALDEVDIPKAVLPLVDVVAESMHASWLSTREALGWVVGDNIDNTNKTHPDLVPFAKLWEGTRSNHQQAAMESIKLLICAGCCIIQQKKADQIEHTKVPNELLPLLELLAYNLHEGWCKTKVDNGYEYAVMRDENKKTHPDILPYYLVALEDRYFDQNSAKASILYILNSGHAIVTPNSAKASRPPTQILFDTDYNNSIYYNELCQQIKIYRYNLASGKKQKQMEWEKAEKAEGGLKYKPAPLDLDAVRIPGEVMHLVSIYRLQACQVNKVNQIHTITDLCVLSLSAPGSHLLDRDLRGVHASLVDGGEREAGVGIRQGQRLQPQNKPGNGTIRRSPCNSPPVESDLS
jgi:hypothetical protein